MIQRTVVRLVPDLDAANGNASVQGWLEALERVTQKTMKSCLDNSGRRATSLEAVEFLYAMHQELNAESDGEDVPPELGVFTKRMAYFEFRLHQRRYVSIEHGRDRDQIDTDDEAVQTGWPTQDFAPVLAKLSARVGHVVPGERPTTDDLLHILFAHLTSRTDTHESIDFIGEDPSGTPYSRGLPAHFLNPVHRSAIFSWQDRFESQCKEDYDHDEVTRRNYAYPHVDARIVDSEYLILLMATPLDEHFVDENVSADRRVCGIVMAIYDIRSAVDRSASLQSVPVLARSFGRALFTVRSDRNSDVVAASFGELATVARQWYTSASDGLGGVMDADRLDGRFDGLAFCEAFVRKMLCKLDGVKGTEVYPWNRAYIFREAGTATWIDPERPIEVVVLEAAIKSENPADRGEWLTRRERLLRGTEDYECSKADKVIKDESRFVFYLHGDDDGIILSRKPKLKLEDRQRAFDKDKTKRSMRAVDAEVRAYGIQLPEFDDDKRLSEAMYNLFGRLISTAYTDRYEGIHEEILNFTDDFWQRRLKVNQRADEQGLYFDYEHGMTLQEDVPLLHALQTAYDRYLEDRFQVEEVQQRMAKHLRNNLTEAQARKLLDKDKAESQQAAQESSTAGRNTKVVWISFSGDLHDENSRRLREEQRRLQRDKNRDRTDTEDATPVLGNEFAYTMILVSDDEPEKTRPQIQREKDDLKTVFQMMMRQVWMDKLNEQLYLSTRTRSVSESLSQFVHRAKGLISGTDADAEGARGELDNLGKSFRGFIDQGRVATGELDCNGGAMLLLRLCNDDRPQSEVTDDGALHALRQRVARLTQSSDIDMDALTLTMQSVSAPRMSVSWADVIVRDALDNVLKNACEAAWSGRSRRTDQRAEVSVRVEAMPLELDGDIAHGFVQVVVTNTGGPVPAKVLEKLNAAEPTAVGQKNLDKRSSTGVGIFLARYQLRESVRRGRQRGDIIVLNIGDDRVETRLILPADLRLQAQDAVEVQRTAVDIAIERDYVLYVEDDEENFKNTLEHLHRELDGLDVHHAKGLDLALSFVFRKPPVLIISDYCIAKTEAERESSQASNGNAFLRQAMEECAKARAVPPIWVITGDNRVVGEAITPSEYGYTLRLHEPENPHTIAAPGTFAVLSCGKQPFRTEADAKAFRGLLQRVMNQRTPMVEPVAVQETSAYLRRIAWRAPTLTVELAEAARAQRADPKLLIVVDAAAQTAADMHAILSEWHLHPGLPEPQGLFRDKERLFALTNRTYHKWMVLALELSAELFAQVRPATAYWALKRNVWLCERAPANGDVEHMWHTLRDQGAGPISAMRHDIKNKLIGQGLNDLIERFAADSAAAETALLLQNEPVFRGQDAVAHAGGTALEWLIGVPDFVADERRSAVHQILRLQTHLGTPVEAADSEVRAMADRYRLSLDCLVRLVGGHP